MRFGGVMAMIAGGRSQFDCALGQAGERQLPLVSLQRPRGRGGGVPAGALDDLEHVGKRKHHRVILCQGDHRWPRRRLSRRDGEGRDR